MVIFSTQPNCVERRETYFEIPDEMPECTGENCICAWFWLPHTGNFYMTDFQCKISRERSSTPSRQLANPSPPRNCADDKTACVKGAKTPIFYYNEPSNVEWDSNDNRPAYNSKWSFDIAGAQTDIFVEVEVPEKSRNVAIEGAIYEANASRSNHVFQEGHLSKRSWSSRNHM
ncbi:hypothetical protein OIV83_002848 [Microbotryomycetes sp. JL201]|nr:hypothetical protein OIV83_002848 [Microbotryomycetes sp. JL201]